MRASTKHERRRKKSEYLKELKNDQSLAQLQRD